MEIDKVAEVRDDLMMEYTMNEENYRVYYDEHFGQWEHLKDIGPFYRSCQRREWVEGIILYLFGGKV